MSGTALKLTDVTYYYDYRSPLRHLALNGVSLEVKEGSFICLTGRTGSGKSTLVQHFDGLLVPTFGKVEFPGGYVLDMSPRYDRKGNRKPARKKKLKAWKSIRRDVGIVFQFPEDQLFKRKVIDDVMVGPKNFGSEEKEARERAERALSAVGLDSSFYERSPFELSGGEKRRAAIAGVLAFQPRVLIMDEPTAGLDPEGASEIASILRSYREQGNTVIVITHDMDLAYSLAERVIVMDQGKILLDGKPWDVFSDGDAVHRAGLLPPKAFVYARYLRSQGLDFDVEKARDAAGLAGEIARCIRE